jgi:glycosyl-4,4'-diaponeurosporenoate acyltransferase
MRQKAAGMEDGAMSELVLLCVNIGVWIMSGGFVGWLFARRPWRSLAEPGPITRLRSWESGDVYERVLFVRTWKDSLPEAGTWFGGISKRRLPEAGEGGLARFAAESLRAERVHLVYFPVVLLTLSWTRGWLVFVTLAYALVVNLPCIVVARYNRVRLAHLA